MTGYSLEGSKSAGLRILPSTSTSSEVHLKKFYTRKFQGLKFVYQFFIIPKDADSFMIGKPYKSCRSRSFCVSMIMYCVFGVWRNVVGIHSTKFFRRQSLRISFATQGYLVQIPCAGSSGEALKKTSLSDIPYAATSKSP